VYDPRFIEQAQTVQKLLCEHANQRGTETSELVLLDEFVQIHAEQLENKAQMLSMDEGIL